MVCAFNIMSSDSKTFNYRKKDSLDQITLIEQSLICDCSIRVY